MRIKLLMRCTEYNGSRPSRFAAHCLCGQPVVLGVVENRMVGVWWEPRPA